MKEGIILGTGNSRYLKSAITEATTWEEFRAALIAGTLPVDLAGINEAGWQQIGDLLGKKVLLEDDTAALYGLDATAVPDEVLALARTLISTAQETADSRSKIETGSYIGTGTYGSDNPCSLTLPFPPKFGVIASRWSIGFYLSGSDSMWVMVYNSSYGSSRHDAGSLTASEADSTIQWYTAGLTTVNGTTSASALYQLNVSDETYDYCFFG